MRELWTGACAATLVAVLAVAAMAQEPAATPEPGVLLGFVDDTAKRPLAGISVTLSDPADPEWRLKEITDDTGAFSVTSDRTDRPLSIELAGAGFQPFTTELRLKPGKELKLGFKLKPAGTREVDPRGADAYRRGVEARKNGDVGGAIEAWREALKQDPALTAAAAELAEALVEQKRHSEAKEAAERLLELSPGAPVGLEVLFLSARALGEQATALRAAEGMRDTSKGRALAAEVSNEGVSAARDGDLETAKRSYELAIAMDSQAAAPLANLAIIRHFEGQHQASLELLERVLALTPKEPNALEYRYLNLCALGREDDADAAIETLRGVDPQRAATAAFEAGDSLFDADRIAGAVASYERGLKLAPEHAPVHHQLGLCYVNLGQLGKAREHLERFLELVPQDPQAAAVSDMLKALE